MSCWPRVTPRRLHHGTYGHPIYRSDYAAGTHCRPSSVQSAHGSKIFIPGWSACTSVSALPCFGALMILSYGVYMHDCVQQGVQYIAPDITMAVYLADVKYLAAFPSNLERIHLGQAPRSKEALKGTGKENLFTSVYLFT